MLEETWSNNLFYTRLVFVCSKWRCWDGSGLPHEDLEILSLALQPSPAQTSRLSGRSRSETAWKAARGPVCKEPSSSWPEPTSQKHRQSWLLLNSHLLVNVRASVFPCLSQHEALREEHDLTDELQVRNDDHHRPEERLDRLGQLCPPGVSRVHGDEDPHAGV